MSPMIWSLCRECLLKTASGAEPWKQGCTGQNIYISAGETFVVNSPVGSGFNGIIIVSNDSGFTWNVNYKVYVSEQSSKIVFNNPKKMRIIQTSIYEAYAYCINILPFF